MLAMQQSFAFVKTWIFWFSDLKIEIAKEDFSKKEKPSSGKYHDEVAKSLIEVLQSTSCLINEEKLIKAIQLINQASPIYFWCRI